jgi:serine/threonine-protein kinase
MKSRALLFLVLVATPAFAQSDPVAAQALFDEARRLMGHGDFAAACPKLAESQRLDPGVGTLLNLAECWDKSGKTARAWAAFRDAEAMALHEKQTGRAQYANQRAAQIEAHLVRLTVDVPDTSRVPSLEVRRDGEVLREAVWGSAVPIDPGDHVVEARAPGYKTFSVRVVAARDPIVVRIGTLEREPEVVPEKTSIVEAPPEPPPPVVDTTPPLTIENIPRDEAPPPAKTGMRTAAFVVGGFGLAGIGLGALFGVLAIDRNATATSAGCNDTTCPTPNALGVANDAKTFAVGADIAFAVSGALVVTSIVLLAIAPRAPATRVASAIALGGFSF